MIRVNPASILTGVAFDLIFLAGLLYYVFSKIPPHAAIGTSGLVTVMTQPRYLLYALIVFAVGVVVGGRFFKA
jgi:hypothetical protein